VKECEAHTVRAQEVRERGCARRTSHVDAT
jgi:hypothetical protein